MRDASLTFAHEVCVHHVNLEPLLFALLEHVYVKAVTSGYIGVVNLPVQGTVAEVRYPNVFCTATHGDEDAARLEHTAHLLIESQHMVIRVGTTEQRVDASLFDHQID